METNPLERRKLLEHEDGLIGHRLSVLFGSQSFLLTAFVLLRNNPVVYTGFFRPVPVEYLRRTELLVYLISFTGILISVCSFLSILGAFLALQAWHGQVQKETGTHPASIRDSRLTSPRLTSKWHWNFLGGLTSFLPGPVMTTIWTILLLEEWPFVYVGRAQFWAPLGVVLTCLILWILYSLPRKSA